MAEYKRANFNIHKLMASKALDIREVAVRRYAVEADTYFSDVEYFITNAGSIISVFNNLPALRENVLEFAKANGDGKTQKAAKSGDMLEKYEVLFEGIGFYRCGELLTGLREAIINGNEGKAVWTAGEIARAVTELARGLDGVYTPNRGSGTAAGEDSLETEGIPLEAVIRYMDELEETRKLRILAVDDVAVVLNTLVSALSQRYEVYALKSGLMVEKFLQTKTPELFLLDIEMDDMSGFELIKLIRAKEDYRDTPIIFLTGNASAENVRRAVELGAHDFVTKPINKEVLIEKIERVIVRKKAY